MMQIFRILYLLLVGYFIYIMIKRGGCCGGHGHSHGQDQCHHDTKGERNLAGEGNRDHTIDT